MNKTGKLFVVSAPSGAGKTTLCERVVKTVPHIVRSVSMTTRSRRGGERQGRDYYFTSASEFKKHIQRKEFLEYAKVFNHYYGTPKKFVRNHLDKGRDVLLAIDVQGAMKIRRTFRKRSVLIFILPPSFKDLKIRLLKRKTDSKVQIKHRLAIAKKELSYLKYYDYQIVNDDIKKAFKKLSSIVIATRCEI